MGLDRFTTREAADILGVSDRRVRALVAQGDLDAVRAGRTLLIQPEALARHHVLGPAASRSLSPRMSWASLLTDLGTRDGAMVAAALGLTSSERGRLLQLPLRRAPDWQWLVRRRARPARYAIRPAYLPDLLASAEVSRSGVSALDDYDVDLTTRSDTAEVYVAASLADEIVHEFSLRSDDPGNLLVHVLPDLAPLPDLLAPRGVMTMATVAVDLLERGESRARRAGLELIARALRSNER